MIEQMSLLDAISKCFSESHDEARRKFLDDSDCLSLMPRFGLLKFSSLRNSFELLRKKIFSKK
jgi:hypothetical protein